MSTNVKRVLVPVANGSEDIETMAIIDTLRRAKFHVDVAAVLSHAFPNSSLHTPTNPRTVTLARGCVLTADMTIDDIPTDSSSIYDCIALPGGLPGAEHLRDSVPLIQLLRQQKRSQKWYAAVCASPAVVFASQGLLQGIEHVTCHPSFTDKLPSLHSNASMTTSSNPTTTTTTDGGSSSLSSLSPVPTVHSDKRVVVDKYCITSQGPGTSIEFALQIIASLESKELAETVAKPMLIGVPLQLV